MIILKYEYGKTPIDELENLYDSIKAICPKEDILLIPNNLSYIENDLEYLYFLRDKIDEAIKNWFEKQ